MTHAIQIRAHGGPEALDWQQTDVGQPGPLEVVIDQRAIGVNFIDVYHRTGLYPLPLPFIPGVEGAGTVAAVGSGVKDLKVGDRVAYGGVVGSYAEMRKVAADRLVKLPESIDFETAAAMMLQGMTAQVLLKQVYKVKSGDTVLVHAAAGGTGLILCQWAAALGAIVIGTVSNREKAELAHSNGCTYPVIHGEEDFVKRVEEITDGKKLPVVYDSIGRDTFMRSLDCLQPRGLMVTFGQASGAVPAFEPTVLAQKGSLYLTRPTVFTFIKERAELVSVYDDLLAAIRSRSVKINVGRTYPLKDAGQAHKDLEARRTSGSIVLVR